MASIAKIMAGRAQNLLQVAAKNPQLAPRFYSAGEFFFSFLFYELWTILLEKCSERSMEWSATS